MRRCGPYEPDQNFVERGFKKLSAARDRSRPDAGEFFYTLVEPPEFIDQDEAQAIVDRFVARAERQKKVAQARPQFWTQVQAIERWSEDESGFPRASAATVVRAVMGSLEPGQMPGELRAGVSGDELRAVSEAVLRGLKDLASLPAAQGGGPHGELKASNVLIRSWSGRRVSVQLADPHDSPGEGSTRNDLHELGRIVYELVTKRELGENDVLHDVDTRFRSLGDQAGAWGRVCRRLWGDVPDAYKTLDDALTDVQRLGAKPEFETATAGPATPTQAATPSTPPPPPPPPPPSAPPPTPKLDIPAVIAAVLKERAGFAGEASRKQLVTSLAEELDGETREPAVRERAMVAARALERARDVTVRIGEARGLRADELAKLARDLESTLAAGPGVLGIMPEVLDARSALADAEQALGVTQADALADVVLNERVPTSVRLGASDKITKLDARAADLGTDRMAALRRAGASLKQPGLEAWATPPKEAAPTSPGVDDLLGASAERAERGAAPPPAAEPAKGKGKKSQPKPAPTGDSAATVRGADVKPEPKGDAKSEAKPPAKSDTKTDTKAERKTEPAPETAPSKSPAPAKAESASATSSNKTPMVIGAVAAVAILAGAGLYFGGAFGGDTKPPQPRNGDATTTVAFNASAFADTELKSLGTGSSIGEQVRAAVKSRVLARVPKDEAAARLALNEVLPAAQQLLTGLVEARAALGKDASDASARSAVTKFGDLLDAFTKDLPASFKQLISSEAGVAEVLSAKKALEELDAPGITDQRAKQIAAGTTSALVKSTASAKSTLIAKADPTTPKTDPSGSTTTPSNPPTDPPVKPPVEPATTPTTTPTVDIAGIVARRGDAAKQSAKLTSNAAWASVVESAKSQPAVTAAKDEAAVQAAADRILSDAAAQLANFEKARAELDNAALTRDDVAKLAGLEKSLGSAGASTLAPGVAAGLDADTKLKGVPTGVDELAGVWRSSDLGALVATAKNGGNALPGVRQAARLRLAEPGVIVPTAVPVPAAEIRALAVDAPASVDAVRRLAAHGLASGAEQEREAYARVLAGAPASGAMQAGDVAKAVGEFALAKELATDPGWTWLRQRAAGLVTTPTRESLDAARPALEALNTALKGRAGWSDPLPALEAVVQAAQGVPEAATRDQLDGVLTALEQRLPGKATSARAKLPTKAATPAVPANAAAGPANVQIEGDLARATIGGQPVVFKRVSVDGRSMFLQTTEVSIGLVGALAPSGGSGALTPNDPTQMERVGLSLWAFDAGRVTLRVDAQSLDKVMPPSTYFSGNLAGTPRLLPATTRAWAGVDLLALPAQYVSAQAAQELSRGAGCRLPTQQEWAAAAGASTPDDANLRRADDGWAQQMQQLKAAADMPLRDKQIYQQSLSGYWRSGVSENTVGGNDGFPLFRPVPSGATEFKDLIGNVGEWVVALPGAGAETAKVIGGSALSEPTRERDAMDPLPAARTRGYSDVGFRLAFDGPAAAPVEVALTPQVKDAVKGELDKVWAEVVGSISAGK